MLFAVPSPGANVWLELMGRSMMLHSNKQSLCPKQGAEKFGSTAKSHTVDLSSSIIKHSARFISRWQFFSKGVHKREFASALPCGCDGDGTTASTVMPSPHRDLATLADLSLDHQKPAAASTNEGAPPLRVAQTSSLWFGRLFSNILIMGFAIVLGVCPQH
ncbi:hypothetical protein Landi51_07860 [Colletotrichum acutatum]